MSREMKDSGIEWIGEIPLNKQVLRNKYYLSYIKGKNPQELNCEKKGRPYIGASDLDSSLIDTEYENYTIDDLPVCQKEDILVLWDGARAGLIGKGHEGVISSTIVNILPNTSMIDKGFLYWYLKGMEKYLYDCVGGTTIPHMNRQYIEDIGMIDWSINEQHKIDKYLNFKVSQIDTIIQKQAQLIEEYKTYKQSLITETVTTGLNPNVEMKDSGIEWIGEIPKDWGKFKLTLLSEKIGDGLHGTPVYDNNGKYYFINGNNLGLSNIVFKDNTNKISEEEYQKYAIELNDNTILISLNGTIGSMSFYDNEEVVLSKSAGYIKLKESVNKKYIYYFIESDFSKTIFELSFSGTTIKNLSLETLRGLTILYPPTKEQEEIVIFLDEKCSVIDNIIEQKQRLIEELETYKKSLIYECVTGKREVPNTYEVETTLEQIAVTKAEH